MSILALNVFGVIDSQHGFAAYHCSSELYLGFVQSACQLEDFAQIVRHP